jgi:hypothetical protein
MFYVSRLYCLTSRCYTFTGLALVEGAPLPARQTVRSNALYLWFLDW